MTTIKLIALSIFMMLGVFCAVLYTSCQKSGCSGVTCLNGGACGGGLCSCKTGIGGSNCETVYRNIYVGTYTGNAVYSTTFDSTNLATGKLDTITNTNTYANNSLVFTGTDTTNYENANLVWNDATGKPIFSTKILLANNSSTGSTFSFTPIVMGTITYTGTGSVNGTNAILNLLKSNPNDTLTAVITINCVR